ncbi:glycoside hydrolase family 42 [Maribacter polysiphoniae]|uniref:Beta-galactosidase n=1 Tax=Maribacter polysiphoniae TaxID=429344 RepID=A0A316DW45_9FLAO|nr:glycoside hydrolase family 42 [Maribacter polysiphoniae]MBD1261615.1 glycoside hydrolase family 42 [Maribacter polysiphoniae]PWK22587.1 beta-galactosidase [Maribacter polysiphoniae]
MKRHSLFFCFLVLVLLNACGVKSQYEKEALQKIETLEGLMKEARSRSLDVTREETTLWFANEFLKFANWDETNKDATAKLFGYERYYAQNKDSLAEVLPDFERTKVIQILEKSIDDLNQELSGEIKRRPVSKVDWHNTKAGDNMFVSNGKPSFPYDYFSKTVGQPLTNEAVYNDHLGAIYHGGENLYPVDHDRAINSFLLKEDGTFDEELMKELTGIPDTNIGFLIYWSMGIPEWVEAKEPEIRKGRSLFTGFDIDNPTARDLWGKIIRHTGELTKGKKVTELGYIFANEPHWYSEKDHWTFNYKEMNGISSYTLNKFRSWLKDKYNGNIKSLNSNWDTKFKSFDSVEIEIPIDKALTGKPIWYDWNRYNMHRSTEWFKFMQDELHAVNPEADTHIKLFPRTFYEDSRSHGIDFEALTELTTMIGHDAKALGSPSIRSHINSDWNKQYAYKWDGMAILHDFLESVGPDKINVNSESHFLSSGMWRDLEARTSYVRNVYWLATLMGMDANMGWFWARDPDGSPEDRLEGELNFFDPGLGGAYAGSNNMQPHIANEVTQVMYDLNSFSEEIIALRKQPRPLRFFYSETSAINTPDYMTQTGKLYKALFFEGLPLGFVTKNIIEKQDNGIWNTVVVYKTKYVTDAEFSSLQSYLDNGGSVIIDSPESLSMNEYGKKRSKKLTESNGKLIFLNDADISEIKKTALAQVAKQMPDVIIESDNGKDFKTVISRVVKQVDGSYLVNLLNLGHDTAKIKLLLKSGVPLTIKNLMTSNPVDVEFNLASEEVLLLEVK